MIQKRLTLPYLSIIHRWQTAVIGKRQISITCQPRDITGKHKSNTDDYGSDAMVQLSHDSSVW